jgi:nicotinate phosphoribosyltransferase
MRYRARGLVEQILEEPIIGGMLDVDFYINTMGQVIHAEFPTVEVEMALTNRNKAFPLAKVVAVDDLAKELDVARALRYTRTDIHYLRGTNEYGERMFREPYLEHLEGVELPPYHLGVVGDQFDLRFSGPWSPTLNWETIALAIIQQLVTRAKLKAMRPFEREAVIARGILELEEMIRRLREYPGLTLSDFGTRRRFARPWQAYVDEVLRDELPGQFLGTSNVENAMALGIMPMGTSAHLLPMVATALASAGSDQDMRGAQMRMCDLWWKHYGEGLSIALPDTFGSRAFFEDFGAERGRAWKGSRQDSGDPSEYVARVVDFYKPIGVDPREKLCIFSNALDTDEMIALYLRHGQEMKTTNGIGTNLTNRLGLPPQNIVIKAIRARFDRQSKWLHAVKTSDDPGKAQGDPETVERVRRVFGLNVA